MPRLETRRADFVAMEELARRLMAMREERGAIDFDLPEPKVILDPHGRPTAVTRRGRTIADRIIEEFMLAANEAVASTFDGQGLPCIWRSHGAPDPEKLDAFLRLARACGFSLEDGARVTSLALNRLLRRLARCPEQRALNVLLLRAMMQATYSAQDEGHFGIAAPHYLHFTSPIRRYPDLAVHRLLKEHWRRGTHALDSDEREALEERLDAVAARSSERERAAMAAEREVDAFYAAVLLSGCVGEEHEGTVTGMTDLGLFVELADQFVEGLVRAEGLGAGASLDPVALSGRLPGGLRVRLGTPVRVQVASVNVARRQIDLLLAAVSGHRVSAGVAPARLPEARPRRPERSVGEMRPKGHGRRSHRRR